MPDFVVTTDNGAADPSPGYMATQRNEKQSTGAGTSAETVAFRRTKSIGRAAGRKSKGRLTPPPFNPPPPPPPPSPPPPPPSFFARVFGRRPAGIGNGATTSRLDGTGGKRPG